LLSEALLLLEDTKSLSKYAALAALADTEEDDDGSSTSCLANVRTSEALSEAVDERETAAGFAELGPLAGIFLDVIGA
jgi:hypothetical protein